MQLRPDIQITSMIKAMTDVILPAVDPTNKLAVEQSQLIVGMLSLMAKQLPIQFRFDRDELRRLLASSRKLKDLPSSDSRVKAAVDRLAGREAAAAKVFDQCRTDPAALLFSIRELREAMGDLVVTLGETDDLKMQLKVERVVLDLSKEQLQRDRAMLVMQGFERNPAALPHIENLLAVQADR